MAEIEIQTLLNFALVFMRIASLLFALPFFGDQVVPVSVRILASLALACGIYPLVPTSWAPAQEAGLGLAVSLLVLRETLIGLVLGYLGKLFFEGLVMAANLVGYQMGFGTASLMMPGGTTQVSAFTALHRLLVMLIFLGLCLHYIFLQGLVESFRLIPAGAARLSPLLADILLNQTASIFTVAMQLGAPILIALLFTMTALGLIARSVPQLNVFTLSFPVSFFVGLGVYLTMLPFLPDWLQNLFHKQAVSFWQAIQALSPP